jgi:hypothetical protein
LVFAEYAFRELKMGKKRVCGLYGMGFLCFFVPEMLAGHCWRFRRRGKVRIALSSPRWRLLGERTGWGLTRTATATLLLLLLALTKDDLIGKRSYRYAKS